MDIFALHKELAAVFGPSGMEADIALAVKERLAGAADEVTTDTLGNLTARIRGKGKKVMFSAHMDTFGLIVTYIDKDGFARFATLGGAEPDYLLGARVVFADGTRAAVCADGSYNRKEPRLTDMYIDTGANAQSVKVGDAAVYGGEAVTQGGALISPHIDNRACCAALIAASRAVARPKNDLYFVFTAQAELGMRGAKTAAYALEPDVAFSVDVTDAGDTPGCKPKTQVKLGGGAAVKLMDDSVICHPDAVAYLVSQAEKLGIAAQRELLAGKGTDAGAIHVSRAGVPTGGISLPARHIHSPNEICRISDIEDCVRLIIAAADI